MAKAKSVAELRAEIEEWKAAYGRMSDRWREVSAAEKLRVVGVLRQRQAMEGRKAAA